MRAAPSAASGAPLREGSGPDEFHPLEIIAFFKRFRPSLARDILYTFIWNCLLGGLFFLVAVMFRPDRVSWTHLGHYLLFSNVIGYTIHALFYLGERSGICRAARRGGAVTATLYYTGTSTLGVVAGYAIIASVWDQRIFAWLTQPRWLAAMGLSSFIISVIIATLFFSRERQARAEAQLERVEREAAAANLRALQAQIEPHFLFNTLANLTSLVDADPATAKRMLESFIRFLRATLSATRHQATTLGEEAELIGAYLDVLQIRMGSRLRYRIDVPAELRGFAIAPMLLQPVVENAIVHGLEPCIEGGEVSLRARREGGEVVVEVADTGVGFGAVTRGGLGLTNLRERLRLLHGGRAGVAIGESWPRGAKVTLRLPA